MFHRVDEPMDLPSSRFFRHAQRLKHRGGAVTRTLAHDDRVDREEWTTPPARREEQPAPPWSAGAAEGTADDVAAIAAMSQHPGFPSIGYIGG